MSKKKSFVVMVIGAPGSGKSTFIQENYSGSEYTILQNEFHNLANLEKSLSSNRHRKIIVECQNPTRESRRDIITKVKNFGVPLICKWIKTPYYDCMFNICWQFVEVFQRILTTEEIKGDYSRSNEAIPLGALNNYFKNFEEPLPQESFSVIEEIELKKTHKFGSRKAIIFDYDGTLRTSKGKYGFPVETDDIEILPNRAEKLKKLEKKGFLLLGASNQSGIHKGLLTRTQAIDCFNKTNSMLGTNISWSMCPHKSEPISCYCRKPNIGMGVAFIKRYDLNPYKCVVVGNKDTDRQFAENCGFKYEDQKDFFE